jgi:hypothetical protein
MRDLVSFVVFVDDDQNSEAPSNLADLGKPKKINIWKEIDLNSIIWIQNV